MSKITWKVINGCGPYAYVQGTERVGKTVRSPHEYYLGRLCDWPLRGAGKVIPGQLIVLPDGEGVTVPRLADAHRTGLGPTGRANVAFYEAQVRASVPALSAKTPDEFGLKPRSVELLANQAPRISLGMDAAERLALQRQVMVAELGAARGRRAADVVEELYGAWKNSANSRAGRFLRWAAAELVGRTEDSLDDTQRFNNRLLASGMITREELQARTDQLAADITGRRAQTLVSGLGVTRKANHLIAWLQHAGGGEVTVYRGWHLDQLPDIVHNLPIGEIIRRDDSQTFSWSYNPDVASQYGEGSIVTRTQLPIDQAILTDRVNNPGLREDQDEVLFPLVGYDLEIIGVPDGRSEGNYT